MNPMTRLRDHDGAISAAVLVLAGVAGIILGIVGAATGQASLSDSGIAITTLAGLAGWAMRRGYKAAMRKRRAQDNREMDSRLAAMEELYEEMQIAAAHDTVRRLPGSR